MTHPPQLRSRSPRAIRLQRFVIPVGCLVLGGLFGPACSVDEKGLGMGSGGQGGIVSGSGGRGGTGGIGGPGGTGGIGPMGATGGRPAVGTGGAPPPASGGTGGGASGGITGSGGSVVTPGSGGAAGDEGSGGSGAAVGSGGAPGSGGVVGSGGFQGMGGRNGFPGACNAATCPNGCCTGDRCMTNRNDMRCGTAGAACAACGGCFHCSDAGSCVVTGTSRWEVICVSATITPTKTGGQVWDSNDMGPPDPICRSTSNGVVQESTRAVVDSLSPMWNESITPNGGEITANTLLAMVGRWGVSVIDEDSTLSSSDPICAVTPQLTLADFAVGTVALPATGNCHSLNIQLSCAE